MREVAAICDAFDPNSAIRQQDRRIPHSEKFKWASITSAYISDLVTWRSFAARLVLQVLLKGEDGNTFNIKREVKKVVGVSGKKILMAGESGTKHFQKHPLQPRMQEQLWFLDESE